MIGIVGAGVTGLTLGHHLRGLGVEHVIFEADAVPGGVVRTSFREGLPLELGPQRTRFTAELQRLVTDLDLKDQLVTAPPGLPLYVYRAGRLRRVPLRPRAVLTTDLLTWPEKLRLLLEPLTAGPREHESVDQYFTRKVGRGAYEAAVAPLYGGLYGTDPARMLVRHGLQDFLRQLGVRRSLIGAWIRAGGLGGASPACSFEDGLATLPLALARANSANVRLSTPVRRVVKDALQGFRVETQWDVVPVRTVVFTCSAGATAACIEDIAPDAARRLRGLNYNPLALVHLQSDAGLVGYGYQVALGEDLETRGVTWNESLFGRPGLQTAFLGGMGNPGIVQLSSVRLGEIAAREFERVTGYEAGLLHVHRTRMPAWDVTWRGLEGLALPPGLRICANFRDRPGIPSRLRQAAAVAGELAGETLREQAPH